MPVLTVYSARVSIGTLTDACMIETAATDSICVGNSIFGKCNLFAYVSAYVKVKPLTFGFRARAEINRHCGAAFEHAHRHSTVSNTTDNGYFIRRVKYLLCDYDASAFGGRLAIAVYEINPTVFVSFGNIYVLQYSTVRVSPRAYYGAVPANTSVFNTLSNRRGTRVLYDRHKLTSWKKKCAGNDN